MQYVKEITEKWKKGQPVSLTDFYGHCVGESLLGPVSWTNKSSWEYWGVQLADEEHKISRELR